MKAVSVDTKDSAHFREVTGLNDVGNGFFTVSNLDGTVISIQPDGSIQTRSAGTTGPWERARRDGNLLFFAWGVLVYRDDLPD